jgi:integral membrane protein
MSFGGQPIATAVMGPVHGAAFLLYVDMLVRTVSGGGFARGEVPRMVVAALVSFGAFVNERALKPPQALLD